MFVRTRRISDGVQLMPFRLTVTKTTGHLCNFYHYRIK